MALSIVRLGSERKEGEGLRIGTVRRPPRGVSREDFASLDWYDVWLPNLSPSAETMKFGQSITNAKDWAAFEKKFRAEMAKPDAARILDLLAALSHQTSFSIGCYCENEEKCHRFILRKLFEERGAAFREI